ncbi:dihydromonapterin reductase [Catenovulum sp. 2E275]|uniref:dihydromonapterin reductase n=1 Tax=Catenovulum sp. 2E275 TaxID=2980497 RepID=UPI0021CE08DF|nr:dihydromonapterin reductase [Catenovulum sp. 2E275]MCU4674696.1 dihydromonapterin reductase [Catenovulum sp. 2E275]
MQNTIIITGGAQRVGLATALALKQAGENLVVTYRSDKQGVKTLQQHGICCIQADFATQTGIDDFIRQIKQKVSSIRAIIHNASDWCAESDKIAPSELMNKMMQVHVQAPYQINLALADLFLNHQLGDIIHITDYAVEKGSDKHIAYLASKAALANLTLSFAKKYAPNIKVNTIAPSLIVFNETDSAEYRAKTLQKSALGIEPGIQEMVKAVEFILASEYMTGRTLKLDGGRHLV